MLSKHSGELKPMLAEEDPNDSEPGSEQVPTVVPLHVNTWRALIGVGILLVAFCSVALLHSRPALATSQGDLAGVIRMDEDKNASVGKAENNGCAAGAAENEKGECVTCHAGRFAPAGSAKCNVCSAGRFAGSGSEECDKCEVGRYSFQEESKCEKCPGDDTSADADDGSQCNVELCGHSCNEVVLHIMSQMTDACSYTFASGCRKDTPPAPFTVDSKLREICPFACEHRNDTVQEELDHRFINANGPQNEAACRGEHEDDNSVDYFVLHAEKELTLKKCMQFCIEHGNCTGIEFQTFWSGEARCEVWTVPINAIKNGSLPAPGFQCFRFDPTAKPPTEPTTTPKGGSTRAKAFSGTFLFAIALMSF